MAPQAITNAFSISREQKLVDKTKPGDLLKIPLLPGEDFITVTFEAEKANGIILTLVQPDTQVAENFFKESISKYGSSYKKEVVESGRGKFDCLTWSKDGYIVKAYASKAPPIVFTLLVKKNSP